MSKDDIIVEPSSSELVTNRSSSVAAHGGSSAVHPGRMIEILMSQPDFNIELLQKFFYLQKEWEDNEAEKAFHIAMSRFIGMAPKLQKNRTASFTTGKGNTRYNWADLAGIIDAIREPMKECGLSHRWSINQNDGSITVTCYVSHELGYQIETSMTSGADNSGSKNSIQAMGSTVEYLKRYTLKALLGLADSEMDDDGKSINDEPAPQTPKIFKAQVVILESLYKQKGVSPKPHLDFFKVESLDDLDVNQFGRIKGKLDNLPDVDQGSGDDMDDHEEWLEGDENASHS